MSKIETKINYPEIKLSNPRYKKELDEFKKIARKQKKDPAKFLNKIQTQMWVKKSEKWYFGPKTIKYLKENIYPQIEAEKAKKLSKNKELKHVTDNNQKNLDSLNISTEKLVKENINNTRDILWNILPNFHWTINVWYEQVIKANQQK